HLRALARRKALRDTNGSRRPDMVLPIDVPAIGNAYRTMAARAAEQIPFRPAASLKHCVAEQSRLHEIRDSFFAHRRDPDRVWARLEREVSNLALQRNRPHKVTCLEPILQHRTIHEVSGSSI